MAVRFSNAAYGPMHLRRFLRSRLAPGERLVGFASADLNQNPVAVLSQVLLVFLPGVGQVLAAAAASAQASRRRVVVMTTRRILLLKTTRHGVDLRGRGLTAELPLERLSVTYPPLHTPAPTFDGAPRRRRRRQLTAAQKAALIPTFVLIDLRTGGHIKLTLPRTSHGGAARLREALITLADDPGPLQSSHVPAPPRAEARARPVDPAGARRAGMLNPDSPRTPVRER